MLTTILVATTACTIYSAALFTNLATELLGPRGVRLYVHTYVIYIFACVSPMTFMFTLCCIDQSILPRTALNSFRVAFASLSIQNQAHDPANPMKTTRWPTPRWG